MKLVFGSGQTPNKTAAYTHHLFGRLTNANLSDDIAAYLLAEDHERWCDRIIAVEEADLSEGDLASDARFKLPLDNEDLIAETKAKAGTLLMSTEAKKLYFHKMRRVNYIKETIEDEAEQEKALKRLEIQLMDTETRVKELKTEEEKPNQVAEAAARHEEAVVAATAEQDAAKVEALEGNAYAAHQLVEDLKQVATDAGLAADEAQGVADQAKADAANPESPVTDEEAANAQLAADQKKEEAENVVNQVNDALPQAQANAEAADQKLEAGKEAAAVEAPAEEPQVEQPVVDAPVEQPVENPAPAEAEAAPAADQPAAEAAEPAEVPAEQPAAENTEAAPVAEEPVAEAPVEEVKTEAPVTEEPAAEKPAEEVKDEAAPAPENVESNPTPTEDVTDATEGDEQENPAQ